MELLHLTDENHRVMCFAKDFLPSEYDSTLASPSTRKSASHMIQTSTKTGTYYNCQNFNK
jgi:hypothetical protein